MTDEETLAAMNSDTPLNKVGQMFSGQSAWLEQASEQRVVPTPIEYRKMEFEAAEKILGVILGELDALGEHQAAAVLRDQARA